MVKVEIRTCDGHISKCRHHIASNQVSTWSSRRVLGWRVDMVGDRGHVCRFLKCGQCPRIFKSNLIGRTENAISGATDAQTGSSRRQNDRVDEYYAIMKQYYPLGKPGGTELRKTPAGLLLGLGDVRCSKFHNSGSRTRNLEVEDFLERWFCYLQVLFRSRSGLKAAKLLKLMIFKTGQIWVKTASTTSSRFERVSRVGIEPNELHAYTKNRGTLNKLTLGILEKFARVSFVFLRVENFTTLQNTSILQQNQTHFHPSFLHNNPSKHKYVQVHTKIMI